MNCPYFFTMCTVGLAKEYYSVPILIQNLEPDRDRWVVIPTNNTVLYKQRW